MTLIRSVSGIRGLVGEDLNPMRVAKFASIFGDFVESGKVIGGMDTRRSGGPFSEIFLSTLNYKGLETTFTGIVPTPTVLFLVRNMKYDGGFIITASHNPPEYNGIKLVSRQGRFLNHADYRMFMKLEEKPLKLKGIFKSNSYDSTLYRKHIEAVLKLPFVNKPKIKKRKLKVVFDGGCGAGSIVIAELLEGLGVKLYTINTNTDGKFRRPLEPIPANLKMLEKEVRRVKADIGLATDGDGDRIAIVTPGRGCISEEYTLALSGLYALTKYNKKLIVINQSTSMMLELLGEKLGFKVVRTPVGEANVVDGILLSKAVIGGEGNGGVILPSVNLTRDALVACALLISMLAESKMDIDEIIDDFPKTYMEKRKYDVSSASVLERTEEHFKPFHLEKTDGLRVKFSDGFLHVRKSGTEPIIRIICEFKTKERTEEIIKQMEGIL